MIGDGVEPRGPAVVLQSGSSRVELTQTWSIGTMVERKMEGSILLQKKFWRASLGTRETLGESA
jgi:hypothetical protein